MPARRLPVCRSGTPAIRAEGEFVGLVADCRLRNPRRSFEKENGTLWLDVSYVDHTTLHVAAR